MKVKGLTTKHFKSVDYDLLYGRFDNKSSFEQLDLYGLLSALRILSIRLHHSKKDFDRVIFSYKKFKTKQESLTLHTKLSVNTIPYVS